MGVYIEQSLAIYYPLFMFWAGLTDVQKDFLITLWVIIEIWVLVKACLYISDRFVARRQFRYRLDDLYH